MNSRSTDVRTRIASRLFLLLAIFCTASLGEKSAVAITIGGGEEELLFQRTLGINRSVNIFDTEQFDLDLRFGGSSFNPADPVFLFDELLITPEDVGETFEATIASGDDFLSATERLTDSLDEFVALLLTENQTDGLTEQRGWNESLFLIGSPTAFSAIESSAVRSVMITVDRFTLLPAGSPVPSPPSPPVDLMLTLSIFGVPEPATAWLLVAGFVTLSTVRRR